LERVFFIKVMMLSIGDNIFSQIIEKDQMVEAGTKVLKSYFTPYVGLQSREQPSSSTYDGYCLSDT
jgi:hypothetical protein